MQKTADIAFCQMINYWSYSFLA